MEDKFDEKITTMLSEDIYIPQKITNRIKTSLKKERKGVYLGMKLNKIVATMIGVIVIGTGVVFAGKAIIENINAVKQAKENDYFEKVDIDYIYSAGLGIKIEDYFIDQGRVGITFNIKSDEKIDSVELYSTSLTEDNSYLEIIDGKMYIRCDESEIGLEYNRRYDLPKFIDENGNEVRYDKDSIGGFGPAIEEYEDLGNNVIRAIYTKSLFQEVEVDKMKVVIKRVVAHKDGNAKEYIGDWEFEIDIADRFIKKSNSIKYNGTVNVENVVVEKAELSATNLIVIIKAENLHKLLYGENGDEDMRYGIARLFGKEGEYNEKQINRQQSYYYEENRIRIKFDISKFNAEDSYKIVLDRGMVITLTK